LPANQRASVSIPLTVICEIRIVSASEP
jgi:hypothetical protein